MVKADIYDRILKLDRFKGSLGEYRQKRMLEGILPNNVQIVPMPTKDNSGYVKDIYHQKDTPSINELSEIIELVDKGCIALVCYVCSHENWIFYDGYKTKMEYFSYGKGIPVMIQRIGGPYR